MQARIAEVDKLLYSGAVTAPKELSALQDEMKGLRKREDRLETDQLELMEEREPVQAAGRRGGWPRSPHDARTPSGPKPSWPRPRSPSTGSWRARGVSGRVWPRRSMPSSWRPTSSSAGACPASPWPALTGGVCGGCHLTLSAVELDRIKKQPDDALVNCEECGRILVR